MSTTDPFTVVVVGGAGGMGRHAVRAIARLGSADHIVVADLDVGRAQRLADEIGPAATATRLDATDPTAMHELFTGCDIVLNTMGPFARFGTPILRAALDAGCDYADIDDDWQSTVEALEFDDRARASGRRVIIGLGASPGTTNVCARIAAERLDEVDDLFTGWSLAAAVVEPDTRFPVQGAAAAGTHWLLQCTGTIRAWTEGAAADIAPLERIDFDFPGVGPTYAYTMGHPEAVTLPRAIAGLRRSINLQCGPTELFDELRLVAKRFENGTITADDAAKLIDSRPAQESMSDQPALPNIWALARGRRDGRQTSVAVYPRLDLPGLMGGHTGIPLAIGVDLLRHNKITGPGVHAPETAFAPNDYFDIYSKLTIQTPTPSNPLLAIEETSDPDF